MKFFELNFCNFIVVFYFYINKSSELEFRFNIYAKKNGTTWKLSICS